MKSAQTGGRESMNIVIVGHVDHGKSTIIGRLLADTDSLPEGKLQQVKKECERTSKPFEYAFLLDALEDEQSQGITIDAARVFFKTEKRNYIIIDAPGHIEFLKNMITGAARAESALLVIDADEGIKENSRRHGYMLSMLGIHQVAVLVNKMDLVGYDQKIYEKIVNEYKEFLEKLQLKNVTFIPVSGREGDNIASFSPEMPWFKDETVLSRLDAFHKEPAPIDKPFRMPVQDVYKFTRFSDSRRLIVGTIDTGTLKVNDEVIFYPSGKKSRVHSIERFNASDLEEARAGMAVSFTLQEQIYIKRGELAVRTGEARPHVTSRFKASLFWLGKKPMEPGKEYYIKIGTSKVSVRLEEINSVIDASNLQNSSKKKIERHDVSDCILKTSKPVAYDLASEIAASSRFVIVDDYEIAGGGIIRSPLLDEQSWVRENVLSRNYNWEKSLISQEQRAERYNQRSALVLISGREEVKKQAFAKQLEKTLFNRGKIVYFIGLSNIRFGLDADVNSNEEASKKEHIRRLAEVAFILLDAGVILIATTNDLNLEELKTIEESVPADRMEKIWVGDDSATDIDYDLHILNTEEAGSSVEHSIDILKDKGIIFKPW